MTESREELSITKVNERIYGIEKKIKGMEKVFQQFLEKKKGGKEMEDNIKFLEKLNEIKPELIKIWAKCDTLDDKIAFNERKM